MAFMVCLLWKFVYASSEAAEQTVATKLNGHDVISVLSLFIHIGSFRSHVRDLVAIGLSLRLGGFARDAIGVDQFAEFGEFLVGELASFDEVGGKAAGGAVEDAVDEFADHRFCGGGLRDGGGPLLAAGGLLAADESLYRASRGASWRRWWWPLRARGGVLRRWCRAATGRVPTGRGGFRVRHRSGGGWVGVAWEEGVGVKVGSGGGGRREAAE